MNSFPETALRTAKNPRSRVNDEKIEAHLPLVRKIARSVARRTPANIIADDLIAAGSMGLLDSVIKNRNSDPAAFASYVRTRIRGAIQDELRASDWLPRRSRRAADDENRKGAPRPVAIIRFEDLPPGSENSPASKDPLSNPANALDNRRLHANLHQALLSLPERDRLILKLHYFRGMKLREIGRLLGITEARVSQIHHRSLARMKPQLRVAA